MTLTMQLDPAREDALRQRVQASGRSTSAVVREAPQTKPATEEARPARPAHNRRADRFGRHAGPADLAVGRRQAHAGATRERHTRRA